MKAPLTPAECDVRSLDWFKLHHKRLTRSAWWKRASDLARSRNVDLWAEAFQQVPAASLPDDDFELAGFAGFGRDVDGFLAIKREIMAPWVRCSDGRWYHPTLAEIAIEAWENMISRRRKERIKKQGQRARKMEAPPSESPRDVDARPPAVPLLEERRGEESRRRSNHSGEGSGGGEVVAGSDKPKPAPRAKLGTRIRVAWTASVAELGYARTLILDGHPVNFTDSQIRDMEDAFYDFWKAKPGTAGTKLDWSATWRTWVREEAKRMQRGGRNGRAGTGSTAADGRRAEREERVGRMLTGAMEAVGRGR